MTAEATAVTADAVQGDLRATDGEAPLDGGTWYVATSGDGVVRYDLSDGALADASHLTFDFLLDGPDSATAHLRLHGGGPNEDATFVHVFTMLPDCEGRVRLPLAAADQGAWQLEREGAWCKPLVYGDPVDPATVDRVEVVVFPQADQSARWCQTPLRVAETEPSRLKGPALPEGPLLDEFGQSAVREWDGATDSERELVERLRSQHERASGRDSTRAAGTNTDANADVPQSTDRDRWGGWTGREFEATGCFRVERTDERWWLVTPAGHPFWSAGLNCVTPNVYSRYDGLESALTWLPPTDGEFADAFDHWRADGEYVNYLVANCIRAFGPDEWQDAWGKVALDRTLDFGFNTVGNWSDWERASDTEVPYVRTLYTEFRDTPTVFRDFPDVFHDSFADDAADVAADLSATAEDPAMVGYFLDNEPEWTFAAESPAAGMLRSTEACATRRELADWLADRYGEDGLAEAWDLPVAVEDVAEGRWTHGFTDAAREDLQAFSGVMVDRLYGVLCAACRDVDPDHLILGPRFPGKPDEWAHTGLNHADVVTVNCYRERVPEEYGEMADRVDAPVVIGEWHFGALDVGLPSPGLVRVPDQGARADAYRVYLENAAAQPWCVGAHYFTMYDQSALGRFDGEHFNIGLVDVCHRPYESLVEAARTSHDRLYDLAAGEADPYDDPPEYLTDR